MTQINPAEIPLTSHFIPAVNKGMTNGQKIMLVLHGRGDTLDSYKTLTKEINVTGLNYLLLNAPFNEFFGYTWYDDSFTFDQRYLRSMELLEETFTYCNRHGFQSEDIFLFGFSQGGRMVLDLFLRLQRKCAGVVAFSPRMTKYDPFPTLGGHCEETPLLLAHGMLDDVIPYKETKELAEPWLKTLKNSTFKGYEMGHNMDLAQIQHLRSWLNELL